MRKILNKNSCRDNTRQFTNLNRKFWEFFLCCTKNKKCFYLNFLQHFYRRKSKTRKLRVLIITQVSSHFEKQLELKKVHKLIEAFIIGNRFAIPEKISF